MKFEVRTVKNGAVLLVDHEIPGDDPEQIVYQETESAEIDAFADFLRFLVDHYGPPTSRYSAKRIRVIVEPGDKYEPRDRRKPGKQRSRRP